jgi:PAS domain S-box-containing protein
VQEAETDVQAGFLIYIPVFRNGVVPGSIDARRRDIVGYVYAPFRAGDFMRSVLEPEDQLIRLVVFDGATASPQQLLFDSEPEAGSELRDAVPGHTVPLELLGNRWTLHFTPLPGYLATIDYAAPRLVLLGGIVISALLFLVSWSVVRRNRQLRAKESEFRYLFEKNPSVMWVYDRETFRFLAVNDAAVNLYGYSPEEFSRMTILDIRPAEDVPRLIQLIERHPEGLRQSGEWRHRTKDGRELIVESVGHTLTFADREASLVVARDMTARRQAEAALAESEQRFRMMADSMPAMLWLTDAAGKMTFLNKLWLDYAGAPAVEQLGSGWRRLLVPEEEAGVAAAFAQACQTQQPFELQHRLVGADGVQRWFLDRGIPRFARDGQFLGLIGVLFDITDLRTAQAQLQQAQKMEAVGRLTGGIAHDFNNLLTLILGSAELLSEHKQADSDMRATAELIADAAERGAELTKRMLAFARRQPLQPAVIDVEQLVRQMEGMLRRALGEDIDIQIASGRELWKTLADPHQLESALLNLAINARDAMPSGGKLTIELINAHLDEAYAAQNDEVVPGDYVMVAVTDTGTGIAPEILEKVFEPFFTTKGVGQGSGLGLSMVYGFVKQSGGHAKVYSEVGHGTTVKLYLPRASTDEPGQRPAARTPGEVPGGTETILVVEDDAMVRSFVQEQLASLGYTVIAAEDGPGALALLAEHPEVKLLFTDVIMPGGMNGRQLADEVRRRLPEMKILFTSGYAESAIMHQGRLDPGVHLLNKPYRRPDLALKVRRLLDT